MLAKVTSSLGFSRSTYKSVDEQRAHLSDSNRLCSVLRRGKERANATAKKEEVLRFRSTGYLIVILILSRSVALSQTPLGAIVGTVRDSAGARMPGSVITIENAGSSFRRSTVGDEAAAYVFPNLDPGTYKLTIMAPGFRVAEYTNVHLRAHQTIRIDGHMRLANQTGTVSVVSSRNHAACDVQRGKTDVSEELASRGYVRFSCREHQRGTGLRSEHGNSNQSPAHD
jgi:hypothetical protein